MENIEKENKILKVLIIILVITLLGVGVYHYYVTYIKTNDTNKEVVDNTTNDSTVVESNSYIGEYLYTEDDSPVQYTAIIDLLENGTFCIKETATMASYYYGNYEVSGNNLKLNYKFDTPSVAGMAQKVDKTIILTIKSNKIINLQNNSAFKNAKDFSLTKASNNYKAFNDFMDTLFNMYISLQK